MFGHSLVFDSLADPSSTLSRRTTSFLYPALGNYVNVVVIALPTVVLLGQALLALLLVTLIVSKSINKRNPTLLNVILVSIFSGFPGLLLFYTGNVFTQDVSSTLCLTQATLKNGVDTMFVMAPLALVIELYMSTKTSTTRRIAFRRMALVALPYMIFFGFAVFTTFVGTQFPNQVYHDLNELYCEVHAPGVGLALSVFGVGIVIITIIVQIVTAFALRRMLRTSERSKQSTSVSLSILYRLAGYTVIQVMYLVIASLAVWKRTEMLLLKQTYMSCMPLLVFLVYGLSPDIIRVWFCMPQRHTGISTREISNPKEQPWMMVTSPPRNSTSSADSTTSLTKTHVRYDVEKGSDSGSGYGHGSSSSLSVMEKDQKRSSLAPSHAHSGSESWDPRWDRQSTRLRPDAPLGPRASSYASSGSIGSFGSTSPLNMPMPNPAVRSLREAQTSQNGGRAWVQPQ